MNKLQLLNRIREIYSEGGNIIQYLREVSQQSSNSIEDILISYDFQAGTYIDYYKNNKTLKDSYNQNLAKIINSLGTFNSILEVGVGEATTLGLLLQLLDKLPEKSYGYDISWSRIRYGNAFLQYLGLENTLLFTGDIFATPIQDNAIDVVYTSHSIEPNGGREVEALEELYRITRQYLVLLEPASEFASPEAQERMKRHGYVQNLYQVASQLGYKIIEHRPFDTILNPLNPTGVLVIAKKSEADIIETPLACPITKTPLQKYSSSYFSSSSLLAYPIIENIPCLLPQNAIVATQFETPIII